jgi:hypothetical protein
MDAVPPSQSLLRRKRFGAPVWIWLVAVLALVGAGVGIAVANKDDEQSSSSAATSAGASADSTIEATSPPATDASATTESPPTTDATQATDEVTTVETTPTDSGEVAGSPVGATGDRAGPVPAGVVADIGGGWRLQILNVNADAAAVIAAENSFNEPPAAGSTFTMITLALGYFGLDDPKSSFETTISAVGSANVELPANCGVIPQELDIFGEIFTGGVVTGNVCFVTTPADATSLQLYASGDLFGSNQVFIDARTSPTNAVPMAALTGPQPGAATTPSRVSPTPVGKATDVGEGWTLTVSGPAADITDAVAAENEFNDPPPSGFRFIGVDVVYAYGGAGAGSPFEVSTKAVDNSNLSLSNQCGVVPGEIDISNDIFSGGSVSGTVCFVAPAGSTGLVLYAAAGFAGKPVMFATA